MGQCSSNEAEKNSVARPKTQDPPKRLNVPHSKVRLILGEAAAKLNVPMFDKNRGYVMGRKLVYKTGERAWKVVFNCPDIGGKSKVMLVLQGDPEFVFDICWNNSWNAWILLKIHAKWLTPNIIELLLSLFLDFKDSSLKVHQDVFNHPDWDFWKSPRVFPFLVAKGKHKHNDDLVDGVIDKLNPSNMIFGPKPKNVYIGRGCFYL